MAVDDDEQSHEKGRRRNETAQKVILIGAIVALLGALLGIAKTIVEMTTGSHLAASSQPPTSELGVNQSSAASLTGQSAAGEPSTPAAAAPSQSPVTGSRPLPTDSSTAVATSITPAVRHHGTLIVTFRTEPADVDAPASDTQWGRGGGVPVSAAEFGRYQGDGTQYIYAPNGVEQRDNAFTYDECRYSQTIAPNSLLELHIGAYICMHTDDDRVSIMHVTAITNDVLTLDVATFE